MTKVLVVEDDKMMAGVLTDKLAKTGIDVAYAMDEKSSFQEIEKGIPDIILLDLILPGVSGFDILKKIKSDERTKSIPVIILSNLGSEADIKKGLDMGADSYLIKANVLVEDIIAKIKEVLGEKTSQAQATPQNPTPQVQNPPQTGGPASTV